MHKLDEFHLACIMTGVDFFYFCSYQKHWACPRAPTMGPCSRVHGTRCPLLLDATANTPVGRHGPPRGGRGVLRRAGTRQSAGGRSARRRGRESCWRGPRDTGPPQSHAGCRWAWPGAVAAEAHPAPGPRCATWHNAPETHIQLNLPKWVLLKRITRSNGYHLSGIMTLLVGRQEGHPACKWWVAGVVICLERGAESYGPADATATHCLLLQ